MLAPVTKKVEDRSTDEFFKFIFHCDICGATWESEKYFFSMYNQPVCSEGEKRAREILWKSDHDAAYERANNEAILHFNKCRKCGKWACDDCFDELSGICTICATEGKSFG